MSDKKIEKFKKEVANAELEYNKARLKLIIAVNKNKNFNLSTYKEITEESQASKEVIADVDARCNSANQLYLLIYSADSDRSKLNDLVSARAKYTDANSAENATTLNSDPKYNNTFFNTEVANLTGDVYTALEDYHSAKSNLDFYESLVITQTKVEPKPYVKVPEQSGHIFPVTMVAEATNRLIAYNNQLSSFVNDVQNYETMLRAAVKKGPAKINVTWIAKIAEKFCKRINYWLAWLRYLLLKALSGIYKKFQTVYEPVSKFMEAATKLTIDNIVGIFTSFLSFFNKPVTEFIKFVKDVATYGPPLVSEGVSLAGTTISAAEYGTALVQEIKTVTQSTLNSDLDPAIAKRLYEKYTYAENVDLSISFDSFSLTDIISGNPQKPKWEDYA